MNDYITGYERSRKTIDGGLQRYMIKVYGHVAGALLVTALAAAFTVSYEPLFCLIFRLDAFGNLVGYSGLGMVLVLLPFGIALYLSNHLFRLPFARSRFLFVLYAALTGISLASLGCYYTVDSLHKTFLVTAITFGTMSVYGYSTSRDLTSVGSFCATALWGLIVSSVLNFFLGSPVVDFVSSFVGVIVFVAFVAYDTQALKALYYEIQDAALEEKAALMGAFSLYLNFLNLFCYLLRFLGERRRR